MIDNGRDGKRIFKHLVMEDYYDVGYYPPNYFDFVFDIGAHIGIFSVMMRMRHPRSTIIAVEPSELQLSSLHQNLNYCNVNTVEKALGDGQPKHFVKRALAGSSVFVDKPIGNESYQVESITLPQLFNECGCKLSDRYLLKFDCEGGERYLVDDSYATEIVKNARHVAMEIHFKAPEAQLDYFLPFERYKEWVDNNFEETHYIKYYISSRRIGYGHYILRRKVTGYHGY